MRPAQIGFPQLVQDFFLRRLVAQRGASARTVEAYRDAFELLLGFAQQRTGKPPAALWGAARLPDCRICGHHAACCRFTYSARTSCGVR